MAEVSIRIPGYHVGDMIGRGAMATVYAATHPRVDRPLALKVMDLGLALPETRQEALSRFKLEAMIGRRLTHNGLVPVHDFGQADELAYMAMDLVSGQPLSSVAAQGEEVPWREAAILSLSLLAVLHYVHRAGIVHRDVKLANIMRVEGPRHPAVKLMDFGVARVDVSDMTQTGDLIGTPAFMSPEQLEGLPVDPRSDLFSVGVILYTLITGQRPFSGSVASVMHQVLYKDPEEPTRLQPKLPAVFDEILARALAKPVENRFPDAAAFGMALKSLLATHREQFEPSAPKPLDPGSGVSGEEPAGSTPQSLQSVDPVSAALAMFERLETAALTPIRRRRLGQALASVKKRASGRQVKAAEALMTHGLEPMIRRAVSLAPLPMPDVRRSAGTFGETCRIVGQLVVTIEALDPQARAATGRDPLIQCCVEAASAYLGEVRRQVQQEEEPDIGSLSPNLLRLEVLSIGTALAGCSNGVERLQELRFRMAAMIMGKVNDIARSHHEDPDDPMARFAMAALLSRVEDLIVVAEQLLDLARQGNDAVALVLEFIKHSQELAAATMHEVKTLTGLSDLDLFKGRLKQVGLIHLFAVRLDSDPCRTALKQLVVDVNTLLNDLTDELTERLDLAVTLGGDVDRRQGHLVMRQLSAIHRLAEQLGWSDLEQRLVGILRDKVKLLAQQQG